MSYLRALALILALLSLATQVAKADAQGLVDEGQRAFENAAFGEAISAWQKALDSFQRTGDTNAEVKTIVSLASAYQAIGQHQSAVQKLEDLLLRAEKTEDQALITLVEWKLGAALLFTRDSVRACHLLEEALQGARTQQGSFRVTAILNDLGNALSAERRYTEALDAFGECISLAQKSSNDSLMARALCNSASTSIRSGNTDAASEFNKRALEAARQLDPSREKVFLLLTAGQNDQLIQAANSEPSQEILLRAFHSFEQALLIAQQVDDATMLTYALGYLAQLYEQDGQADDAVELTQRAIFAAQRAQMPEALYRWEWQLGRLLRKQDRIEQAILAYRAAEQALQPIRYDVSTGYGNAAIQLSFRESVGPLFYELSDLLLSQAKTTTNSAERQKLLLEARDAVENLKTVELEDYFCDECVDTDGNRTRIIEEVDERSAVVYLIPLPTRTEILVGLNSGLELFTVDVSAEELAQEAQYFRRNLETRTTFGYLAQARELYKWFILPIWDLLREKQVDTLVFVPDGALRTIPFAALHDGNRFLIEEWAVSVVPGLSLVEPKAIERRKATLLVNGITEPVQGFPPLYFVTNELYSIDRLFTTETLLNQQFSFEELNDRLRNDQFSIVHIASHGQFDRDVRNTFVLTYDNKLTLNDLEAAIRPSQYRGRPVEMLVLSACQTAVGDDRAALGLAGVAIKAGARSALASLWYVNDESTAALITEFYRQLHESPSISKSQALQAAQTKLLADTRYQHPAYWSPWLIIGNWL